MIELIVTLSALVVLVAIIITARWAARRRQRLADEALREAPADALAAQAAAAVRYEGWQRLGPGAALIERDAWTDEHLLAALDELWRVLVAEDEQKGQHGRSSNYFEFYDCGLARIAEVLHERLGLPPRSTSR